MHKLLLLAIIALAFIVRVYHHHHVLTSDEANNMLTIKALIEGEGLREYFFKHPPLFILFSSMITYPFGDNYHLVQYISIVFSSLSFIPLYLIVKRAFNKGTALLSLLVAAVLPANILYSAWVKQDAMLIFFFMWSVYFYIANKPYKSGIFLGIASLTKEFAWFLLPITLGWEMLKGWEGRGSIRRYLIWLFIGTAMSGWWYAIFGAASFKATGDAVIGGNLFEYSWHYPWHYYLGNLPADLSWVLLPFFVAGLMCLVKAKGIIGAGFKPAPTLFPLLWVLAFYLPLSLMRVKAPWYTYLATPAIGIVIASGLRVAWNAIRPRGVKIAGSAIVAVLTALNLCYFSGDEYYRRLLGRKLPVFYEKEYLSMREEIEGEKKVAILDYNPTIQYYLGIPDRRLFYPGPQFAANDRKGLVDLAEQAEIGWFVIDANSIKYVDKNIADMASLWGEPKRAGDIMIFRVRKTDKKDR